MHTVLLTGFEPFGGDTFNPSAEIAQALNGAVIGAHHVRGAVLPCVFGQASNELLRLIALHHPVLVICLGLAAGRSAVTPERVAINLMDARIPDNAGEQPTEQVIEPNGPTAYGSTLPVKGIVSALQARGIRAEVSESAGTFVCNQVFYRLMHALAQSQSKARGGFIHVPSVRAESVGSNALTLATLVNAMRVSIEHCLSPAVTAA